ncbi:Uncharacterised protein [Yokenella regensburgei]|uniref:Secreted protein n=1 Tax=Yokenella regensburgei TaxID=158877 RepID=A0AB38FWF3_9ENTR|nr:Uncharacterised protein [Yokenella regensburgei]
MALLAALTGAGELVNCTESNANTKIHRRHPPSHGYRFLMAARSRQAISSRNSMLCISEGGQ